MPSYWQLLALVAPVFVLFALGALLRRTCRLTAESEAAMLRIYVNLFYPALILKSVLGNAALRDPANLLWPPVAGFVTIVLGFAVGYFVGRALGLHRGAGLRTFAFAVGIYNYGSFRSRSWSRSTAAGRWACCWCRTWDANSRSGVWACWC